VRVFKAQIKRAYSRCGPGNYLGGKKPGPQISNPHAEELGDHIFYRHIGPYSQGENPRAKCRLGEPVSGGILKPWGPRDTFFPQHREPLVFQQLGVAPFFVTSESLCAGVPQFVCHPGESRGV